MQIKNRVWEGNMEDFSAVKYLFIKNLCVLTVSEQLTVIWSLFLQPLLFNGIPTQQLIYNGLGTRRAPQVHCISFNNH